MSAYPPVYPIDRNKKILTLAKIFRILRILSLFVDQFIELTRQTFRQLLNPGSRLAAASRASRLVEQTGEVTRNIMEVLRLTVLDSHGLQGGLRH